MAWRAYREQSPSRRRRPRDSKAEQTPDRRLVVDQLTLRQLGSLVGTHAKVAQLGSDNQIFEKLRAALQLGEVLGMQDDRLDVLRTVALNHERLAWLRLRQADIVALDRRTVQSHKNKIAVVSDGIY